MADPVSMMAIAGMAAAAGGGITAAMGNIFGGNANKAMYDYQAGIAGMNATLAKQDAEYTIVAGKREEEIAGIKGREIVGSTRAGFGASNLDTTRGSPAAVLQSEREVNAANLNMIRANAAKKAYGFEVQAAEDTAQGKLFTMAGDTSMTAGEIGAASSLLGAVGSVSSKWVQGSQAGVFASASDGGGVNPDSAYGRQVYRDSIYS